MGMVMGKIDIETPKYEKVEEGENYEIRHYAPYLVAEVTYDGTHFKSGSNGGFMSLAGYLGVTGKPKNTAAGNQAEGEKIAMTAPVITQESQESEKIAMTAPVITAETVEKTGETEGKKLTTMQFVLPSKYTIDTIPKPTDPNVRVKEFPGRDLGVIRFSGFTDYKTLDAQSSKLRTALEAAKWKTTGDYVLARYNPPWTVPFWRTNEILYPVEKVEE